MLRRFLTDSGIEVPGVTTVQMREVDWIAVEETGLNLNQMMENAGRNLALLAIEILGKGSMFRRVWMRQQEKPPGISSGLVGL